MLSEASYECYPQKIALNVIYSKLLWMFSTEDSYKYYLQKIPMTLSTEDSYKWYVKKIAINVIYWRQLWRLSTE